jgi:hypothetical protein
MEVEFTAELVIGRLEEAGKTLLSLPGSRCYPANYRIAWPAVVLAAVEAYGYTAEDLPPPAPAARAISDMDEAWRWITLIPLERGRPGSGERWSRHGGAILRRVVLMRALVNPRNDRHMWSWRKIGLALGCSHQAVSDWHAKGVDCIVSALGRVGLCSTAGGCVPSNTDLLPVLNASFRRPAPPELV